MSNCTFEIVWKDTGKKDFVEGHSFRDALTRSGYDVDKTLPKIQAWTHLLYGPPWQRDGVFKNKNPLDDLPEYKPEKKKRGKALYDTALKTINGDRQNTYGNPEDSFASIAERWNQYLKTRYGFKHALSPGDVAFMMADLKMARECHRDKRDNMVDAVGYLGIRDDM